MGYDKIIASSRERSAQKMNIAKQEIQRMLESKERITFTALIENTGLSKGFFYRNSEMRQCVNEAMHQQTVTYNPKQVIYDLAMEKTLVNMKTNMQELKSKADILERENAALKQELEELKSENARLKG